MSDTPVVLGIETSCDETGLGVVAGTELRSNVLASQVDIHARFGGVVPEVAARAHVEAVRHLAHRALSEAGVHQSDLDGIAATQGPGLVGALVVGFTFAKSWPGRSASRSSGSITWRATCSLRCSATPVSPRRQWSCSPRVVTARLSI